MRLSRLTLHFTALPSFPQSSDCLPSANVPSNKETTTLSTLDRKIQPHAIEQFSPPHNPPITALSPRSPNTTRPRIEYLDFTFLIPSQAHVNLLRKMYADVRTAALNAIKPATDVITPEVQIAFQLGVWTFAVGSFVNIIGTDALIDYALFILEELALVMYPITFSLTFYPVAGMVLWASGSLDGSLVNIMRQMGYNR